MYPAIKPSKNSITSMSRSHSMSASFSAPGLRSSYVRLWTSVKHINTTPIKKTITWILGSICLPSSLCRFRYSVLIT